MINHENNFATNLTSGTSATDTTSPLNAIPSAAAPFYIAFDATNINGHYEVLLCTSKTATNVNHAALSYDHTTAEEVRMVVPASEIDTMYQPTQGFLINGKIVPSVASNNLTVAIKTMSGADPSASSPVHCRIGNTVQTITAALSVTKAAGTNWCNSGGAELATKEIDYFVYLGYNATDGVVIGFSRIPFANQYSDFSATTTNEKYCAISTISNAAATDYYEVIGRFAATLSAGAGYTWTVPTFTAANLIQRPIYETRLLNWSPTIVGFAVAPSSAVFVYKLDGECCIVDVQMQAGTSNATNFTHTLPFTTRTITNMYWYSILSTVTDNSTGVAVPGRVYVASNSNVATLDKTIAGGAWTNANNKAATYSNFRFLI